MVAPYVTHFERLVSQPRFDKYRPSDQDDLETLVTYLWNAALAEALFQGLSAMEVALRNVVHPTFTTHIGTEYWFQAVLLPEEMKFVNDVWMKLSKRHKRPPTPGKIIAELTFGFWPHLFDSRYHDLWWDNKTSLFRTTFPHIPTNVPPHQSVVLKTIHQRVELCQKLRNRVMHHEPIFTGISILNKPSVSLVEIHDSITEMLGWIDPHLATTLGFVDRFPDVHQHEQARIRARLETHFGR